MVGTIVGCLARFAIKKVQPDVVTGAKGSPLEKR